MKYSARLAALLAVLVLAGFVGPRVPLARAQDPGNGDGSAAVPSLNVLDGTFIRNKGQWPPEVLFQGRAPGLAAWLTNYGMTFSATVLPDEPAGSQLDGEALLAGIKGHAVELKYVGANQWTEPRGENELDGRVNYMIGPAEDWAVDIPRFGQVVYKELWPLIDMVVSGAGKSSLEQLPGGADAIDTLVPFLKTQYVVLPGGDAGLIRWSYSTGDAKLQPSISPEGALVVPTSVGDFLELSPTAYQVDGATRTAVEVEFVIDDGIVGFRLGRHDPDLALVIDPFVGFSRRIGGSLSSDYNNTVREDLTGRYISGTTFSTDFPVTAGVFQGVANVTPDVYAAKFNLANSSLIFSTFLGGGSSDYNDDFILENGQMVLVGSTLKSTTSTPWPGNNGGAVVPPTTTELVAPTQMSYRDNSAYNCTVAKLGTTGTTLPLSTAFGASTQTYPITLSGNSQCLGIARAASGEFWLVGNTTAFQALTTPNDDGWPATGAYINNAPGTASNENGFVLKLTNNLATINAFTFLGQGSTDGITSVAIDPTSGNPVSAAYSLATTITPMAFTANIGPVSTASSYDHVITEYNQTLTGVTYNTRLGGTSSDYVGGSTAGFGSTPFYSSGNGANVLKVDASGRAIVAGTTFSAAGVATQFPITAGTFQQSPNTTPDALLYRLNAAGTAQELGTFLGSTSSDYAKAVEQDSAGNFYVVGGTLSTVFPTTPDEVQTTFAGGVDGFRTIFNPTMSALVASTFFGGSSTDWINHIVLDASVIGRARVSGSTFFTTTAPLFPTTGPDFVGPNGVLGSYDTFVAELDALTVVVLPQSDLRISKTTFPVGQTTVIAGNTLTYRVSSTNLGPEDAAQVVIQDTLPANTVFVSAVPTPAATCTFTLATRLVDCRWANPLVVGATYSVDITVRVCPDLTCNTVLSNSAITFQVGRFGPRNFYTQPFTSSVGDFTVANVSGANNADWAFDNLCTPSIGNLGTGHTAPGNMRWGRLGVCTDYGSVASGNDIIRSPVVSTAGCVANAVVNYRYYLDYQETATFDQARVRVNGVLGAQNPAFTIPPGGSSLVDETTTLNPNPSWKAGTINFGTLLGTIPATVQAQFEGQTLDGIGNAGWGFHVDDVTFRCDQPDDPNPANNITQPPLTTTVQTQSQLSLTMAQTPQVAVPDEIVTYTLVGTNLGPSNAAGTVIVDTLPPNFEFVSVSTTRGACTVLGQVVTCNVGVLGAPNQCATVPLPQTVTIVIRARAGTNLWAATPECPEGLATNSATIDSANCLADTGVLAAALDICVVPKVDPNGQLGKQVHLPILNFQGQDDVCRTWIEIQNIGPDFAKAVLVTWGEPGFCPPQCAGPLKVECTGLLKPGSTWNMMGAQIPTGSKGGMIFKFSAKQISELFPGNGGDDDIVADAMCEDLFFGVVGDCDDYRRFKKAYNEGLPWGPRGLDMGVAAGDGFLAVDVLRACPGDVTPGVEVTSKYNGLASDHLGKEDPIYGGYSFYVPLLYADKAGYNSIMYIQNGGLECSSIEIWFKAQDDCLRAKICEIFTLAPGETYQWDASDCVGPDWQGSAWLRSTQPLGIAVDIIGRDVLMTYVGEPGGFNYIDGPEDDPDVKLYRPGDKVAYGPLIYSEYQGWDTGVQVMNQSPVHSAKVKVYFLDRSGDIITTLVDWVCARGSQTFFLPVIADLPGSWIGSIRVESQEWWAAGSEAVTPPSIVAVAQLIKYNDSARTQAIEALAYNLLPEHKAYLWQIGWRNGLDSGIGLIAIPSLLKDLEGAGITSEVAIANLVPKPGFTDFAIYIYDQNGLIGHVCEKLNEKQVEYINLETWGYVNPGFKGSAIISAVFWEHDVFDPEGVFLRNLVGLGAVSVERTGTRLGEDVPGDEAAGDRGIPFEQFEQNTFGFSGPEIFPACPGVPKKVEPGCPASVTTVCSNCPLLIPDSGGPIAVAETTVNVPAGCLVDDVDVRLDITHTWDSDLDVSLANPAALSQVMFNDICGSSDNLQVILDDEATQTIGTTCPPLGFARWNTSPNGTLTAFEGQAATGKWLLSVDDDAGGDVGTINVFSLEFKLK